MHAYYNTKAQMSEQLKSPIYYRQHCIVCTETCTCTACRDDDKQTCLKQELGGQVPQEILLLLYKRRVNFNGP